MNRNPSSRYSAAILTWISIASLVLVYVTAIFGPQSGMETMIIIIPLMATVTIHAICGPIALLLSWRAGRSLATFLIWFYFIAFTLVALGYWAWFNDVPRHARSVWREWVRPEDARLSDSLRPGRDVVMGTEATRAALEAGADVGHQTPEQRTPLIEAVIQNNAEALQLLLDAGADPSQRGATGETPLFAAASRLQPTLVKLLLRGGADPNQEVDYDSPLCRVMRAAASPNLSETHKTLVTDMVAAGALGTGRCGQADGASSFSSAIGYGMRDLVAQLVAAGRAVRREDLPGLGLALYDAVHRNEYEWTLLLLQAGIPPDMDGNRRTALELAVGAGKINFVQLLLTAGADPRARPYAFQISRLSSDQTEVMEILLKAGASPDDGEGRRGGALYQAAHQGRARQVQLLLAAGADRNAANNSGVPLLVALQQPPLQPAKARILHILIDAGANLEAADKEGRTALLVAVQAGNTALADRLYRAGASLEAVDSNGRSAAHLAAELYDAEAIVSWLAQQGADFSRSDKQGQTPICLATTRPRNRALKVMLEAGARHFECGAAAEDVLWQAVTRRDSETVALLLRFGADPDFRDALGVSALEESARRGFHDGFDALLAAGADPNTLVKSGRALLPNVAVGQYPWRYPAQRRTPRIALSLLTTALLAGNTEVIKMLLQAGADPSPLDSHRATPLHALASAEPGTVDVYAGVKLLIHANTDHRKNDSEGFTAATRAAQRDRLGLLLAMAQAGIDLNESDAQGRQVVMELAAKTNQAESLRKLLEAGLEPTQAALATAIERRAEYVARVLDHALNR